MEGMILFLGMSILVLSYTISFHLRKLTEDINKKKVIEEQNQIYLKQFFDKFEINNYKKPW